MTEKALHALGFQTVGQLAAVSQEKLEQHFGRWGTALYRKSRGEDSYEFFVDAEPKSISHNQTFSHDTDDPEILHATLSHLCQKSMKRLRDASLDALTVTLTIRYEGFETITRSHTLREATHLDPIVFEIVRELFERNRDHCRRVRLLGVGLSSFTHGGEQLDLLDAARRAKLECLAKAADKLRDRFGFSKVQFGGSLSKGKKKP